MSDRRLNKLEDEVAMLRIMVNELTDLSNIRANLDGVDPNSMVSILDSKGNKIGKMDAICFMRALNLNIKVENSEDA